jgi:hypothetical protein
MYELRITMYDLKKLGNSDQWNDADSPIKFNFSSTNLKSYIVTRIRRGGYIIP